MYLGPSSVAARSSQALAAPVPMKDQVLALFRFAPPPPEEWLIQDRPDNCAQTVVAMVSGRPVREISRLVGKEGALSVSEVLILLAQLGLACRPVAASLAAEFWSTFVQKAGGSRMRGIGFRSATPGDPYGHAYYLFGRRMYDPANGEFTRLDASALRSLDWIALFPASSTKRPAE